MIFGKHEVKAEYLGGHSEEELSASNWSLISFARGTWDMHFY